MKTPTFCILCFVSFSATSYVFFTRLVFYVFPLFGNEKGGFFIIIKDLNYCVLSSCVYILDETIFMKSYVLYL